MVHNTYIWNIHIQSIQYAFRDDDDAEQHERTLFNHLCLGKSNEFYSFDVCTTAAAARCRVRAQSSRATIR